MKKILPILLLVAMTTTVFAGEGFASGEFAELRKALAGRMPDVSIGAIRKLPYADLYEIQGNGVNIFYTDASGEVALFGNLVNLATRQSLSEQRKQELMVVDFSDLPLDKAIVKVKGNGSRKLAVFSDPDCPYCKELERELEAISDTTIYTFLYPIAQLHPDAPRKARLIWCAPDRSKAWDELMLQDKLPDAAPGDCEAPLGAIEELARKYWITGTPGMVFESDRMVPGVLPHAEIEKLLTPPARS